MAEPAPAVEAILGIGANIGDALATTRAAVAALDAAPGIEVVATSSFYATPPWGFEAQDWFVNLVAAVRTRLPARALLEEIQAIERRLGRTATFRWGPRVIDIDIVAYGTEAVAEPDLVIPHREALNRAFVMVPLAEIRPDLVLGGVRAAAAAGRFGGVPLRVLAPPARAAPRRD